MSIFEAISKTSVLHLTTLQPAVCPLIPTPFENYSPRAILYGIVFSISDLNVLGLIAFITGKLCVDVLDIVSKALNQEMVPTSIRANTLGVYDTMGRLGGVAASFIILLVRPSLKRI